MVTQARRAQPSTVRKTQRLHTLERQLKKAKEEFANLERAVLKNKTAGNAALRASQLELHKKLYDANLAIGQSMKPLRDRIQELERDIDVVRGELRRGEL